ncbi:MAG: antifreeze protein type I [Elusimicrobia bacterium]|nr:MAG: antifreeze protein type I [Elusimicrobiota bacterium]
MAIIDVVKFKGGKNALVWKHPVNDLSWGTQVIVHQSQEAIFFKGGQALDVLGPGTHTLRTSNLPILRRIVSIPFGGETPFAAEVYYVNKATKMDVKWGTKTPIPILDPRYNIFLPVRAFGQFGIKVQDARKFVVQLSGTMDEFTVDTMTDYFRGVILTKAKDYIAETIIKKKINMLEITAHLEEISTALHQKIQKDFSQYGISLVNFYLNSVNVPDDDPTVKRLKKALSDKAEMDILGDNAYRTKRTFDTMEKAAGNQGTMGGGMGLGMGLGAGAQMGGMMSGMMGGMMTQQAKKPAPTQITRCTSKKCKADVPATAKFCPECGSTVMAPTTKCPGCKGDIAAGAKFCEHCGKKVGTHACPKCNTPMAGAAKFCGNCGHKSG